MRCLSIEMYQIWRLSSTTGQWAAQPRLHVRVINGIDTLDLKGGIVPLRTRQAVERERMTLVISRPKVVTAEDHENNVLGRRLSEAT